MTSALIPELFTGETAIIAGTGPSLTPESIEFCNQARQAGKARIFAGTGRMNYLMPMYYTPAMRLSIRCGGI